MSTEQNNKPHANLGKWLLHLLSKTDEQPKGPTSKASVCPKAGNKTRRAIEKEHPRQGIRDHVQNCPLHLHIKALVLATCVRIGANMTWVTVRRTKGHIEHTPKELPESLTTAVLDKAPQKGTGT